MKKRLLYSVHIWAPAVLSVLSLFWLVVYSVKVARLEGKVSNYVNSELALRAEIQTLQAYVNSLEKTIIKSGIEINQPKQDNKKEN